MKDSISMEVLLYLFINQYFICFFGIKKSLYDTYDTCVLIKFTIKILVKSDPYELTNLYG